MLVTVKEPSCCADSLIQDAVPLWTGAGGAPGPGSGAEANGILGCWSSDRFGDEHSRYGVLLSAQERKVKLPEIFETEDECRVFITSGSQPFLV